MAHTVDKLDMRGQHHTNMTHIEFAQTRSVFKPSNRQPKPTSKLTGITRHHTDSMFIVWQTMCENMGIQFDRQKKLFKNLVEMQIHRSEAIYAKPTSHFGSLSPIRPKLTSHPGQCNRMLSQKELGSYLKRNEQGTSKGG